MGSLGPVSRGICLSVVGKWGSRKWQSYKVGTHIIFYKRRNRSTSGSKVSNDGVKTLYPQKDYVALPRPCRSPYKIRRHRSEPQRAPC